ncbi:FdhD protein [Parasphingorhabdus marina DSM 22363]|uniref:Sulfur carrier protein FdhD n=1 Tax=Parasphingorhabdus marina DSM 22363 TaxID=1123272 RepID=A0A1N6D9P7_9SPHN|nr:formate dehydrogenase accessory sulfurtransferase FdhD [Parasphingorhabdus marina]SIN67414.1 FdhD protein [Parasphingorhabdus marina DSM 22363]
MENSPRATGSDTAETVEARRIYSDDKSDEKIQRKIAIEAPISVEFNGIGYAVMMATPSHLRDFVIGFATSEKLIEHPDQLSAIDISAVETGWIIRANIVAEKAEVVFERARTRVAESSCGLCGIENLEVVGRPLPPVPHHQPIADDHIFRALAALTDHQQINADTGGVHAAAWVDENGAIGCVREDVGRHNALDKLIGAMSLENLPLSSGFILTTSRCSYEIVEKSVVAGATTLVTISVPTSLAIARAKFCGLSLVSLARSDSALRFLCS